MSKCPHCGAEFEYDVKSQLVHCDYCGSDFNPTELKDEKKGAKKEDLEGKCYSCTQCGATLLTFDETAVTFCSYCGSQNMIEEKMIKQNAPDVIIPFTKTQEECIKNYKNKISSSLFCPNYMKDDLIVKKFRGIFMPYGIYKMGFHGDSVNKGEKYSHTTMSYKYYDKYDLHAKVDATYDGISYDLISKFYDDYSHSIPFNYKEAVPFKTSYLPGFYADTKDVDAETYVGPAALMCFNDSTKYLKTKKEYAKYGCDQPTIGFTSEEKKYGMFPVYFLATKDKKNENLYYAIINGQTGKVAADLPVSFIKYIIISLILSIPIFLLLIGLPTIIPTYICIFAIVMAIIAWAICAGQIRACNNRYKRIDDKGFYADPKKEIIKDKYKMSFKYWWKLLLAIIIPFIPVFVDLVDDYYSYGAASISLFLILLSFFDLVKIHNLLVSRPIPQLEKRGGDENE